MLANMEVGEGGGRRERRRVRGGSQEVGRDLDELVEKEEERGRGKLRSDTKHGVG